MGVRWEQLPVQEGKELERSRQRGGELPGGRIVDGRVEFGDREFLEQDRVMDHDVAQFWQETEAMWRAKIGEETARAATQEEERGGLLGGMTWSNQGGVLANITQGLERFVEEAARRVAAGGEAGPPYPEPPDCNPKEYRDKVQGFVSGSLHLEKHVRAWEELDPPVDPEVLDWVRHQYEVRVGPEGRDIQKRNGLLAREHWEDHQRLVLKLLKQGSWEIVEAGSTDNVLPMNLAEKLGADPPWRLILNAIDLNDKITCRWKIRYEGIHTLAMTMTQGCWGFTLDLKDGYYALHLRETCRGLFGAKLRFSKERIAELEAMGVDTSQGVLQADGTVELTMRPRGLVMGFTNTHEQLCSVH